MTSARISETTIMRLDAIMQRMEQGRIDKAMAKSEASAMQIAINGRLARTSKLLAAIKARRK